MQNGCFLVNPFPTWGFGRLGDLQKSTDLLEADSAFILISSSAPYLSRLLRTVQSFAYQTANRISQKIVCWCFFDSVTSKFTFQIHLSVNATLFGVKDSRIWHLQHMAQSRTHFPNAHSRWLEAEWVALSHTLSKKNTNKQLFLKFRWQFDMQGTVSL